ncbi:MAG: hypothetical protein HRU31_18790 [Rhodobacteraceae bacterium]|nr:hypothetical protein [Paracoccaceae bacterium]
MAHKEDHAGIGFDDAGAAVTGDKIKPDRDAICSINGRFKDAPAGQSIAAIDLHTDETDQIIPFGLMSHVIVITTIPRSRQAV